MSIADTVWRHRQEWAWASVCSHFFLSSVQFRFDKQVKLIASFISSGMKKEKVQLDFGIVKSCTMTLCCWRYTISTIRLTSLYYLPNSVPCTLLHPLLNIMYLLWVDSKQFKRQRKQYYNGIIIYSKQKKYPSFHRLPYPGYEIRYKRQNSWIKYWESSHRTAIVLGRYE